MQGNGNLVGIVCEGLSRIEGVMLKNLTSKFGPLTARIFQNPIDANQHTALVDLYKALDGTNWYYGGLTYTDWQQNTDPCQMPWVCSLYYGYIIYLHAK